MTKRFRPLLALFSVVVLATVAACGGSSSTPTPKLTDAKEIVVKGIGGLQGVKAFHLQADLSGSIQADLTGSGTAGTVKLDGTTASGDVDVSGKKLHFTASVPAFLGFTGEIIMVGNDVYYKTSMTGAKWTHMSSPNVLPSALPSAGTDPQQALADLKTALDNAKDLSPTLVGTETCGSTSCYHVKMTITSSAIANALASAAPLPSTDLSSFSGSVDLWVETNTERLVKADFKVNGGTQGSIDVTLTLSNFDKVPTITAPPADQVTEGTTG